MTYFSIRDAATETGISKDYLRKGCRNGTIPHIMCGKKYLIDVPLLLEQKRKAEEEIKDAE